MSYLDAREGHNIVSKIQNSAFVNYGVVRVAKKQDSRGAKFDTGPGLESVQDFLIKLDIKTLMHLMEISIFSLNNDLIRFTKIMNNLVKDFKILSFKVIF